MIAVARWRVAVSLRSMSIVAPALAELLFLGVMFTTAPQTGPSALAATAMAMFVLGLWFSSVNAGALGVAARNTTSVSAGLIPAFIGEVLAGAAVVGGATVVAVVASRPVQAPALGPVPSLLGFAAVLSCGLVGVGAAAVLTALRLGTAPRVVLSMLVLVSGTVSDRSGRLGFGIVLPPALRVAQAIDQNLVEHPASVVVAIAVALAWSFGAALIAVALVRWREDRP